MTKSQHMARRSDRRAKSAERLAFIASEADNRAAEIAAYASNGAARHYQERRDDDNDDE